MTKLNKIKFKCECDGNESDVQCKLTTTVTIDKKTSTKMLIQIKCLSCKHNHYLPEDDSRCQKFFKKHN